MFDMLNKTQNSVYATTFSSTNFWLKMAVFAVYNNINTNLVVYMIFILRKNGMHTTRDINWFNEISFIENKASYLMFRSVWKQKEICHITIKSGYYE